MARRMSFESGEWYHCYNRGVDKRNIFENESDANRLLMLLYLANSMNPIKLFHDEKPSLKKVLVEERGPQIVAVGAYCLMPNHYHLLLQETIDDGITSFMRKIGTAYTMYFNRKNGRAGHLFSGPFRAKHIGTDRYFQQALRYVHCNPAELYERGWKIGKVRNMGLLERKLVDFPYSSLKSFIGGGTANPILSRAGLEIAEKVSASVMLRDACDYYASEMKPDEV